MASHPTHTYTHTHTPRIFFVVTETHLSPKNQILTGANFSEEGPPQPESTEMEPSSLVSSSASLNATTNKTLKNDGDVDDDNPGKVELASSLSSSPPIPQSSLTADIEEGGGGGGGNKDVVDDGPVMITEADLFQEDDDDNDESFLVGIPKPGVPLAAAEAGGDDQTRSVPNLCAICLSTYDVGDELVWASNPACHHAFHKDCIERWLVKQRGGPLCPCCRREFVIDPLDDDDDDDDEGDGGGGGRVDPLAGATAAAAANDDAQNQDVAAQA
mmetsp:Transcript_26883/g.62435  ORF Transcript_26883/g.62435 Transcript_26883/m.62435 type:complete len:272 (-) Transcript_26883:210-1025(-)